MKRLLMLTAILSLLCPPAGARHPHSNWRAAKLTFFEPNCRKCSTHSYTRWGQKARWGVVAANPSFVSPGSLISIEGYAEPFTVSDTGPSGAVLDICRPARSHAENHGVTRRGRFRILRVGWGKRR